MLSYYHSHKARTEDTKTELIVIMLALMCKYSGALSPTDKKFADDCILRLGDFEKPLGSLTAGKYRRLGDGHVTTLVGPSADPEGKDYAMDWKYFKVWVARKEQQKTSRCVAS